MTPLEVPDSWADEYCLAREPELFNPSPAELATVRLSYGKQPRWFADFQPDEVAGDLADGMTIEQRDGNDGPYYVLAGTRLDVFAQPRVAASSHAALAYVTSVKPARGLGRSERISPGMVRLAPVWDEEECDLAALTGTFADGLRIIRQRRALQDRARRGLRSRGVAPRPRAELHAQVRQRYQPLLQMLELLEQRSELEGRIAGSGVAVGEAAVEGDPALWLRLDKRAAFAEGRTVVVAGPGVARESLRVRAVEFDEDGQLLAVAAPKKPVPPASKLRLEQQGRFALGKHRAALRQFLSEQVEGDWEHLALLLCEPSRLPVAAPVSLRTYYDRLLNADQRLAVNGAVGSPHVYHVQGPPGTGKTTVITEVVRQLTHRGERVLLLAPMHVAVDEVLRRLADQPGILALRYSWDESRVAADLRRYLPEQATRTYLQQMRTPATSQATRWRSEHDGYQRQHGVVSRFLAASSHEQAAIDQWHTARTAHAEWRRHLAASSAQAAAEYAEAERALAWYADALPQATAQATALRTRLREVPMRRRIWASVRDVLGLPNEVAELSTACRAAEAERDRLVRDQQAWSGHHARRWARIGELASEQANGERRHQETIGSWQLAAGSATAEREHAAGELQALAGVDPGQSTEDQLTRWRERLAAETVLRERRIALEQRWFELSSVAGGSGDALAKQVDADLRRSANLVCCTTTGVNKDIGASDFDTLIVDEASRVVDTEFLIGAVRSRRWVLVGDEHQLPPYVEPDDEHHLHALAALHMTERKATADLPAAVTQLGKLWVEDEELHRFRNDTVLRTATHLRDTGAWQRDYRNTFDAARRRLREVGEDPERTLLSAMRDHLVRSLFERSVVAAPNQLRHRIPVQHRMIEPIAELVSQPVYGGDYVTPPNPSVAPLYYGGTNTPVVFVDTSAYGERARDRLVGTGMVNDLEAELIQTICQGWEARLRRTGGDPVSVSVLSFYKRQAIEIRNRLGWPSHPAYRALSFRVVDAIDKIQGQQSDLVFISFCRTYLGSGRPSAGFGRWLQDIRRLNVACTRARRSLVLVGHAPTLMKLNGVPAAEAFYRNLFTLLDTRADMEVVKDVR